MPFLITSGPLLWETHFSNGESRGDLHADIARCPVSILMVKLLVATLAVVAVAATLPICLALP
jgi:hypothetical protein